MELRLKHSIPFYSINRIGVFVCWLVVVVQWQNTKPVVLGSISGGDQLFLNSVLLEEKKKACERENTSNGLSTVQHLTILKWLHS